VAGLLTENDVVDAVCAVLEERGYHITERALTTEHGPDIVARRPKSRREIRIEAKGATSSKPASPRFGTRFTRSQVHTHVAKAFYTAAVATRAATPRLKVVSAIALPDTDAHRNEIQPLQAVLGELGIGVFWVGDRRDVEFNADWRL
jgi:hypothetical protein